MKATEEIQQEYISLMQAAGAWKYKSTDVSSMMKEIFDAAHTAGYKKGGEDKAASIRDILYIRQEE